MITSHILLKKRIFLIQSIFYLRPLICNPYLISSSTVTFQRKSSPIRRDINSFIVYYLKIVRSRVEDLCRLEKIKFVDWRLCERWRFDWRSNERSKRKSIIEEKRRIERERVWEKNKKQNTKKSTRIQTKSVDSIATLDDETWWQRRRHRRRPSILLEPLLGISYVYILTISRR